MKRNLEKIFGSKARVEILGYLFFVKDESYIRDFSNKLGLFPSAVKREVDNLEEIGVLIKEGNRIKLNKSNSIVDDLKNIFLKMDFIVYPIKEALDNKKVEFAFIFGSFARGSYVVDSDVDLMVVGDVKLEEIIKLISRSEKKIGRDINPVVWTLRNLKKEKHSGFVKDIFKKGVIMIRGDENEVRKIVK